jgi:DNA-binding IclR family transcriptional regulator
MNVYVIPNLRKACEVLKTLSQANRGLTIAEIAGRHNIPRTTALRILSTLCMEGLLAKREGRYYAGMGLVHLGLHFLASMDIRAYSVPILMKLAVESGETAHLAVLSGDKALIIEVCDSPHPIRVASRAGSLVDLHCSATGKIFIAHTLSDRIDELFGARPLPRRTANTITSLDGLRREVEKVRQQGHAFDDEEYHEGIRCVAAPVRDAQGTVVGAIGITAGIARFTRDKKGLFAKVAMRAADQLSSHLGYRFQ